MRPEKKNKELETELAQAYRKIVTIRNQWFEVFEDMQKEQALMLENAEKCQALLEQRALKAEQKLADALDKIAQQRRHIYELETELEEEKGKNLKLRAQINRDYENSSLPSSRTLRHKKSLTAEK